MNQPSALDGVPFVLIGTLAIVFRRPFARHIKASKDGFDRANDEDGLASLIALIGTVAILLGVAAFLLWATA